MDEYGKRGLKVLAFPCNQFGGQEPGGPEDILKSVKKYDANMLDKLVFFEKRDVNGAEAREVFSFLKHALPAEDGTTDVRWNFNKFLIDHKGVPHSRFGTMSPPFDMRKNIEELLEKKEKESAA